MAEPGICALVLAAGQGSRYRQYRNEDKLRAPCRADEHSPSVLEATLLALQGAPQHTLVVVREDNRDLRDWLAGNEQRLAFTTLAVATRGLGHSLAQGAARQADARGWLVVLGDMPYVRNDTFRRLASALREDRLVVPVFQGQRGHPRGIGAAYLDALLALDGDQGAQALFASNPLIEVEVDDPGVLQDVDRPQDRLPAC